MNESNADTSLTTDKQGKVMLGSLKDIIYIQADSHKKEMKESWMLDNIGFDKWT